MAATATVFILRLHVNTLGAGFTETYVLPGNDYATVLPVARNVCLYRRGLFGLGCTMPFASVSQLGPAREARAAIDEPLGPHPETLAKVGQQNESDYYPDNPDDALVYRMETALGQWTNRFFRGIADISIKRFDITAPYVPYATGAPQIVPATDTAASLVTYIRSGLAYIRDNTLWHKTTSAVKPDPGPWNLAAWVVMTARKVGLHKTGRPFGQLAGRRPSV